MSVKRLFSLMLVLILAMSMLTGCGNENQGGSEPAAKGTKENPWVIGFSINNLDEYMTQVKEYTEEWDAQHDEVVVIYTSAEANLQKQIADCESFISQGVDFIFITALDVDGCAPIVDLAHEANIPVGTCNDEINHPDLDYSLGESAYDVGVVQADTIKLFLEENPDVNLVAGHILGDLMYAEVQYTKSGLMDGLADVIASGRVTIIDEKTGEWSSVKAMNVTEDWLVAHPEMNCVIGMSDEMALGALQALNAADRTMGVDTYLFGKDGSARGVVEVKAGQMTGTVRIDSKYAQLLKMDTILRILQGENVEKNCAPDSSEIYIPMLQSNVDEVMEDHPV